MLNKTIDDDEPVCVCVCVCARVRVITKDKMLPFSKYNVRIYKFAAHLKPCDSTPAAEHCPKWSDVIMKTHGGCTRDSRSRVAARK
jgi:hypothetical protein